MSARKKTISMSTKPDPDAWVSEGKERHTKKGKNFKRLTLDIPEDLHRAIKRQALEEDTTMLDLMERWARENVRQ
jgi:hypothetical protein